MHCVFIEAVFTPINQVLYATTTVLNLDTLYAIFLDIQIEESSGFHFTHQDSW